MSRKNREPTRNELARENAELRAHVERLEKLVDLSQKLLAVAAKIDAQPSQPSVPTLPLNVPAAIPPGWTPVGVPIQIPSAQPPYAPIDPTKIIGGGGNLWLGPHLNNAGCAAVVPSYDGVFTSMNGHGQPFATGPAQVDTCCVSSILPAGRKSTGANPPIRTTCRTRPRS